MMTHPDLSLHETHDEISQLPCCGSGSGSMVPTTRRRRNLRPKNKGSLGNHKKVASQLWSSVFVHVSASVILKDASHEM